MKGYLRSNGTEDGYTMLFKREQRLACRIDVGTKMRHKAGKIFKQITDGKRVLILHQNSLPAVWLEELQSTLSTEELEIATLQLAEGESCKTPDELVRIWAFLQSRSFGRQDCIIAMGGGAVTDVAGFAASTYLRGIKLILIPTTLLAQVDASIGGKTGINLDSGKNLAGSFYFPDAVLIDPEYLSTLPTEELKSGIGEIVKYALIETTIAKETEYDSGPISFLSVLENSFSEGITAENPALLPIISCCVRMKLAVVLSDPYEERLRRCLNLGHTLGHAIEKVSNYGVSHGEAVATGCLFAMRLAASRGLLPEDKVERVKKLLDSLGLKNHHQNKLASKKLLEAMSHDKKKQGQTIRFVLPKDELGKVDLDFAISLDEIAEQLN